MKLHLCVAAAFFVCFVPAACAQRNSVAENLDKESRSKENKQISISESEKQEIIKYIRHFDETPPSVPSDKLKIKLASLNNNGVFVAFLNGAHWCGSSSCTLFFFGRSRNGYESYGVVSGVQLPVLKIRKNVEELPVLETFSSSMGGYPSERVYLEFDSVRKEYKKSKEINRYIKLSSLEIISENSKYISVY